MNELRGFKRMQVQGKHPKPMVEPKVEKPKVETKPVVKSKPEVKKKPTEKPVVPK